MSDTLKKGLPLAFVISILYFVYLFFHNLAHVGEYSGWRAYANGISLILTIGILGLIFVYLVKLIRKDKLAQQKED